MLKYFNFFYDLLIKLFISFAFQMLNNRPMKYVIVNKNCERMYQFPIFDCLDLATKVCIYQRSLKPSAGYHVVKLDEDLS